MKVNQINRDVYVLSNKIKDPINYVQGTDALDIVFNFRDFEIPDSSSAQVFVSKPSGKGVYNTAVIAGNAVTVNTTPEMFSEVGNTELQINIRNNGELLTSFIQPVVVQKNLSFHGESGNESDFFEEYIEKIDTAISEADTATDSANAAASDANSAASNANDAAEDIRQKAESGEFSATVKVGTVTASEPGGDAEVTNTGTAQDAVFNFVLPRGEQGPKGDKGDKGDTGAIENIDGVSVDFSPSSTRQNIATGDTFSTLFGKIAKWFADLGTAAFQGVSNALTQTSAGYVLDARQGKALNDAKLNKTAVVNNLTTTAAGYALDARQGKALNDAKLNKTSVVNNLTATAAGYALDARQGKVLADRINKTNTDLSDKAADLSGKIPAEGNGYIRFADGTLIQWGRAYFQSTASGGNGSVKVNFSVPFTSTPRMSVTPIYASSATPTFTVSAQVYTDTATLYARTNAGAVISTAYADWMAIGK